MHTAMSKTEKRRSELQRHLLAERHDLPNSAGRTILLLL